ncbi:uncharacterized protein LOC141677107 isoform X2 [Apium graveolens]|uniref:uncharacterized protein LOC141677107 isoform X2 n=1 Tax=Apium graveolens TaxID=4045 RepID=UPI003D7A16F8
MTENSNGIVILITLLNVLVYKLQKLQDAQQTKTKLEEAEKTKLQEAEKTNVQEAEKSDGLPFSLPTLCRRFPLEVIQSATDNFSEELVIGKGGFGNVYKGTMDFGERKVAVKRRKLDSKQGVEEFHSEIEMLSKIQHCNIVSLIGYCADNEEMILVYEYMPRQTLADHLYKRTRKGDKSLSSLSWVQRLKICIGAAHGLGYLHTGTGTENRVIHRDVKAENILLDENLAAKVSDFGLSKTGPANQTCTYVNTGVKGTHGYLDPYYVLAHRLTRKSDVYAFGVLLFEVLCGRPALDKSLNEEQIKLAEWAQHCFGKGLLDQITDPYIKGDISSESLNVYVTIAMKCLNFQPKLRPTMAEVVVSLESALTFQEKSKEYTLVEIMPDDFMEDEDCLIRERKDTNHKHEYTGKGNTDFSNGLHHKKQTSATRTFMKREYLGKGNIKFSNDWHRKKQSFATNRISCFPSVATWIFSVNQNAKTLRNSTDVLPSTTLGIQEEILQSLKLKRFTFSDLSAATRKFHPDSVIGRGGFGPVFRGWVDEKTLVAADWGTGLVIAVKELSSTSRQGHLEWLTEIKCLVKHSHPNLVKLIGYCSEEDHRLLVYEFIHRGDFNNHLFRRGSDIQPLSWKLRMSMALGAAKGLAYLHSPEVNVIHRDIKLSNILIDSNYNAKLSDFGLAKDGPEHEETHVSTLVRGTFGYLDPQYYHSGSITMKTDVYGFGVVLLEILTGRRAIEHDLPIEHRSLVSWAHSRLSEEHVISDIMDADIKGQYTVRAAIKASSLALKCTSLRRESRPDAKQIVEELEQLLDLVNLENMNNQVNPTENDLSKSSASSSTPSQHVSQPPDVGFTSSIRPSKIASHKMREGKWSIKKSLGMNKRAKINEDWGWGSKEKVNMQRGISPLGHFLSERAMMSLAPGSWVDDRIVYMYMALLHQREQDIQYGNIWERKSIYYFMDPYFMVLGMKHVESIKTAKKGDNEEKKAWDKAQHNFSGFVTATVGPSAIEADYIFIPCCIREAHWVLFIFSVKSFEVVLLDSMNDNPDYPREKEVVTWLLPKLFGKLYPNHGIEYECVPCHFVRDRPTQQNSDDCGVFVMKYMDFMLQGYDITTLEPWSQDLVETFRYRIAMELQNGKARQISNDRMRKRLQNFNNG